VVAEVSVAVEASEALAAEVLAAAEHREVGKSFHHKTNKTMQNYLGNRVRLHNRVAAGKQPVGMFPTTKIMVLIVLQVL